MKTMLSFRGKQSEYIHTAKQKRKTSLQSLLWKSHTNQNCFKLVVILHGILSTIKINRNKRILHSVNQSNSTSDDNHQSVVLKRMVVCQHKYNGLSLAQEQIQQLLQLLSKNSATNCTTNLASNFISLIF